MGDLNEGKKSFFASDSFDSLWLVRNFEAVSGVVVKVSFVGMGLVDNVLVDDGKVSVDGESGGFDNSLDKSWHF